MSARLLIDDRLVDATPELIAEIFAGMGADEQARFYNHIAQIASNWPCGGWPMQLQYITDDAGLTDAGRRVMQSIGEYSHWGILRADPASPKASRP